jgi:glyoxylase-like metal-dependent hydrolase (beta-lactamase superfamily II)
VTFDDKVSIWANGEEIHAVHFPHGHTDGDSVIFFSKSNVVHMGDDFFNGLFPIIDIDNGGSAEGMLAGVEKILATLPDDVKIIPGHGPLGDKKSLRAFADMLKGTIAAVEKEVKVGKTLDQIKKDNVLAAWADTWGKGGVPIDRYTETLFNDLSRASSPTK